MPVVLVPVAFVDGPGPILVDFEDFEDVDLDVAVEIVRRSRVEAAEEESHWKGDLLIFFSENVCEIFIKTNFFSNTENEVHTIICYAKQIFSQQFIILATISRGKIS